ncbi:MAG: PspA/IM30 family protein [Bradymonadaceae bacterium]|nr:PspA/IM30 family protein [Lujinxingiaceae bacterium]
MSILNRLNLLIRSNLNDTLSGRAGDSSQRGTFQEMESSLRDARRQQIELRAGEKRLIAQIRASRERADQWEERAMLALRANDEQLAREALVVKNKALRESEALREQLDEHRAYMRDIDSALEALEMKLESTRGRMRATKPGESAPNTGARSLQSEATWDAELRRRAKERESGQSTAPPAASAPPARPSAQPTSRTPTEYDALFETDSQFREFDRMSSRIDSMEAEIDAIRELSSDDDLIDPRRAELERIFNGMETKKVVKDDLADLKKKFES